MPASREVAVRRMPSARYELRGVVSGPNGLVGDVQAADTMTVIMDEKSAVRRE
jgi:hypothetical protein